MKTATALSEPTFLKGNRFWKPWEQRVQTASKSLRTAGKKEERQVEVDFSIFTPKDYLLSHATIVGGVEPEENGHWITPTHNQWVNDNGNAWLNQLLLESYRSFIMAENYQEHIQLKELSKGKILDSVAWVVRQKDKNKKEIPTVFIDILVATDKKKHPKLVEAIQSGKLSTLSMGCDISHSQCSKCGDIFEEGEDQCEHLEEMLNHHFRDSKGNKHRIAELCGVAGWAGSCDFIEASWVGIPAWEPAKRHSGIKIGQAWMGKPLRAYVPASRMNDAAREAGWLN